MLLGVVALATLAAALLHGPALAGLGLVGAFVTPVLLSACSAAENWEYRYGPDATMPIAKIQSSAEHQLDMMSVFETTTGCSIGEGRPDCGYQAARAATDAPVAEGSVGAGAGATVGKAAGMGRSMKGGDAILALQKPVDYSLRETSAWLRVTAQAAEARRKAS